MAMSAGIRRELCKSRELLWLLLHPDFKTNRKCFFCKQPLLCPSDVQRIRSIKFGNGTAPPMELESLDITEHHIDENHSNNRPGNLALSHGSCHKSHHAKLVFSALRGAA